MDLPNNPERFTGYAGPSANKVWRAIYDENCFGTASPFQDPARALESGGSGFAHLTGGKKQSLKRDSLSHFLKDIQGPMDGGETEQCLEKRVYYRLISGLHASISIHICDEYLDQQTGEWSPNLDCFISRIGEHPERLQNVYFDYVVFLRALAKAGPYLEKYDMCTGNDAEDAKTKKEMKMLLSRAESCHNTFDESGMFAGQDSVVGGRTSYGNSWLTRPRIETQGRIQAPLPKRFENHGLCRLRQVSPVGRLTGCRFRHSYENSL